MALQYHFHPKFGYSVTSMSHSRGSPMSVELAYQDQYAIITLNRVKSFNAINFNMLKNLNNILNELEGVDIRGLAFIGAGDRSFCSGADINELNGPSMMELKRAMEFGQHTFDRLYRFKVPTLAIINGFAFGGGLELAMACMLRVATPNAKMGLPEIKLGAVPGYGGTQRLPRLVGEGRALEMIMSGRAIEAEEAERIGLVNRIVARDGGDPLDAGLIYLSEFSGHSMPVLGFVREAVQRALDMPISEGLRIEADLNTQSFQTEDVREGLSAYLDKRPPVFNDR